ncbi:MAG: ABC transporter ATP-binding protein [Cetobacterium sp.]
MELINLKKFSFKYKDSSEYIIEDLDFSLEKNKFTSILGPSGCGKTTLLKLLCGLEPSDLDFKNISISYMPQKDSLLPWRTALENISLPLELKKISKKKAMEKSKEILKRLDLLEFKDYFPKSLSGGMKQRISFGRTLLEDGELFLLDEPFSALDAITKLDLREWVKNIFKSLEKTSLLITHDVEEAIFLSDIILVAQEKPIKSFYEFKLEDYSDKTILKNKILNIIRGSHQ